MNIAYIVGTIMLVIVGTMVFFAKRLEREQQRDKNK